MANEQGSQIIVNKRGERNLTYIPTGNNQIDSAILGQLLESFFPQVDSSSLDDDPEYQAMIKRLVEQGINPFDEL